MRFLDSEEVRNMCIRYGFYTCGDCNAYENLLHNLCNVKNYGDDLSVERLEKIARDIVDHSDRSVFEQFDVSFKIDCIQEVAELISNRIKILMVP